MVIRPGPPTTNHLIIYLCCIVLVLVWAWAFEDDIKARIQRTFPAVNLNMSPRVRKAVLSVIFPLGLGLVGYVMWWGWRYTI